MELILQNSFPYFIIILFYFILFLLNKKNVIDVSISIRFTCVIIFILFFGFRGFIGSDWYTYYYFYNSSDTSISLSGFEPGFTFIVLFLKYLKISYHEYILLLTTFLAISIDKFFIRYSTNYILSWCAFIVFGGWVFIIDLQRNVIALCIFLFSLKYIINKKIIPFVILNLIGVSFHSSAILYIPFYFIARYKPNSKFLISIFVICNLIFICNLNIINYIFRIFSSGLGKYFDLYTMYADGQSKPLSIGFLERTITFLLIILLKNKLVKINNNNIIFINLYLIYFIFYNVFSGLEVVASRLSLNFKLSYWILIPAIYNSLKIINNKRIFIFYIFTYSLLWIVSTTKDLNYKYENILFGYTPYEKRVNELGLKEIE